MITQLFIGGSKVPFRCVCRSNLFYKINIFTFKCKACGKNYRSDDKKAREELKVRPVEDLSEEIKQLQFLLNASEKLVEKFSQELADSESENEDLLKKLHRIERDA